MDVKKSHKADLDSRRASGFLLGLVVALSLFLVALEFTTRNGDAEADGDVFDDMSQDIEMAPVIHSNEMVAAMPSRQTSSATGRPNVTNDAAESKIDDVPEPNHNVTSVLSGAGIGSIIDIPTRPLTAADVGLDDNPLNFQVVEKLPEFPGGMSEFVKWLTKNLKYPATAQRNKKQGTVLVAFIINKDGSTTGHKVVKSAAPELDREALRVIRLMPKWKPGEDRGKPCRTYFCIPVVFKL